MIDQVQDREDIRVHLQMMQSVIARMADNSRACKTWAVTVVAAILVTVSRIEIMADSGLGVAWIAVVPVTVFGCLDVYYLASERWFRKRYSEFVGQLHSQPLDPKALFHIPKPDLGWRKTIRAIGSFTIWPVYLMLIAAIFAVYQWG